FVKINNTIFIVSLKYRCWVTTRLIYFLVTKQIIFVSNPTYALRNAQKEIEKIKGQMAIAKSDSSCRLG
ncbi:hypothetical protein, partial [Rivularia sp. UHCC 0363]|uniref:hypothetical protein n=1 Tax=Rivularia sp. UHCC 0363 TaxID=3110244 RepID=UPI002B1EA59B